MYEHISQPLLPKRKFYRRVARHGMMAVWIILLSLLVGVAGYHFIEGFGWVDSILNASMILGGMGPVNELHTTAGKLFASVYAIFSGVVFLVAAGVLFAPMFHRFLHKFHLDMH